VDGVWIALDSHVEGLGKTCELTMSINAFLLVTAPYGAQQAVDENCFGVSG
jgi:hypothetical protein